MRASTSVWSRSINRLFGTSPTSAKRRKAARRAPTRRHGFERLEDRMVLSATFGSALSIGNDIGGSYATDIATDQAGNSYVTGRFSGTVDFDLNAAHLGDTDILTARGSGDAYVAKYAPDDSLVWVQRMGGDASNTAVNGLADVGRKIAVDGSGNVYVVGEFIGPADFGSTTLSSAGDLDGFVAKLNAGGAIQWAKSWGTTADDQGRGVGVDSSGNVYALGTRWHDAYTILKFSPTGSAVRSQSIGAYGDFSAPDLAVDASGNAFVAGSFSGTVDFDPGSRTNYVSSGPSGGGAPNEAGFVLKLDTKGKFGWVSPFVGQMVGSTKGYAYAKSVALDSSGNVVVGGGYDNSVDFNPGSGTTTLPAIGGGFITKLNSSGGLVWARALEDSSPISVTGLAVDAAGSIYATGYFYGTVDLDPGAGSDSRTSTGGADVFVVQLTAAGNLGWAESFGADGVGGIAVDTTGVVHVAGLFQDTVDFDPDPFATYNLTTSVGSAFRLRLRQV